MMDIKPCPFCKITPNPDPDGDDFDDIPESLIAVTCHCIESDDFSTRYVELPTWNTRPIEDAQAARIAELEMQLAEKDRLLTWKDGNMDAMRVQIADLEAQLAAVPKWNPLTASNRPEDGVYAIWLRRPIGGNLLHHYIDVGFQWAPYDIPPQVEP